MLVRLRQEVQALPWRAGNVALNRAPDLATAPSFTSFSRNVANRAHRGTISAAPQEMSQSRRNYNVACWLGVVRELFGGRFGGSHVRRAIVDHVPLQCRQ